MYSLYTSFNIFELLSSEGNMFYWSNPRSDIAEDTGTAALVSRLQAAEEARLQETIWWAASDLRGVGKRGIFPTNLDHLSSRISKITG